MASLVEELIVVLREENEIYERLIPIAERKTQAVVKNDIAELEKVTDDEQVYLDQLGAHEKKRMEIVQNMGIVLNRKPETLNLHAIVDILQKQPEEQKALKEIHDKLKTTAGRLKDVNVQNKALIKDSLEMIEFNLNFIRSTRMSSGSSNYGKDASQADDSSTASSSMFDAKQ